MFRDAIFEIMSESSASEKPEPSPFEKMRALATQALSVPKSEVDKREQQWREERDKKRRAKRAA